MIIISIPYINNNFVFQQAKKQDDYWQEFRLDYSQKFRNFPTELLNDRTIITLRNKKEDGNDRFNLKEKLDFYLKLTSEKGCFCDIEIDEVSKHNISTIDKSHLIISYHDHSATLDYDKIKKIIIKSCSIQAKYLKIALPISKYSDFNRISQLINLANKPVIFAGLGDNGKLGRILYKHLGAAGTFIGILGHFTSKQQLTSDESELFRLDSITTNTQILGIIGGEQVKKSIGINYYNQLFSEKHKNAIYLPFVTNDLDDFLNWIESSNLIFYGFSITMPFKDKFLSNEIKQTINLYLPVSKEFYNSDLTAFKAAKKELNIKNNESVLILGSGATAKTALIAFGASKNVFVSSRNELNGTRLANKNKAEFISIESLNDRKFKILINCTPLGSKNEDLLEIIKIGLPDKVIELTYRQKNTLLINHCIENDIKYIDGKRFWFLQAIFQEKKILESIDSKE
ncbi:MAG: type I 3-dehydroquinate dehydratase [Candidatus Cloacimonetes bacterium]|nr:type I 3-dehydroquinate dehydratase [Candidatus Cloacimonadota bacterium]